jgi:hypothetical protein
MQDLNTGVVLIDIEIPAHARRACLRNARMSYKSQPLPDVMSKQDPKYR